MKFIPLPSSSPRILRGATIDTDPPIHFEIVHDPKDGKKYLSIGIGGKSIRRTWLSKHHASGLIKIVLSMTDELRRE